MIKATTEFDCNVPIPLPQANIGADSEGPGKPLVLDPQPIAVRASAGESTRIMDHDIIAVSTVTGKANIQIIPIYLD
jgi:hypothetical protein